MTNKKWFYPVVLILLWIIMAFIVNPIGNFPLNDDWQYARPVGYLINNGYYFSPDGYSPIILSQVMWGALFCLPAGFSFTTLRISVMTLGIIGVLVFYFLIRRITKNNALAFLGGLILLINPMFFSLSYSFMTDVPFLTFAIISVYFFYCSFESYRPVFIIMATLFSVVATLTRQFGVIIPIAYGITCLIKSKSNLLQRVKYFLPAFITIISLQFGLFWLEHIGSPLRPFYGKTIAEMLSNIGTIAFQLFDRSGFLLFYAGFFLLPLLLFKGIKAYKKIAPKAKITSLGLIVLFLPSLVHAWSRVPLGNIFNSLFIGPFTLSGKFKNPAPEMEFMPQISNWFSLVCFVGAIFLLWNLGPVLLSLFKRSETGDAVNSEVQVFVALSIMGYALLLFIFDFFFDRYLMLFIPFFFLLLCNEFSEMNLKPTSYRIIPACIIILIAVFSMTGTHDYLAWNRSRWEAVDYISKVYKVIPQHVNGGYEVEGWTNHPITYNDYYISFGESKGYKIVKQFPYQNYLPFEVRNICVMQKL